MSSEPPEDLRSDPASQTSSQSSSPTVEASRGSNGLTPGSAAGDVQAEPAIAMSAAEVDPAPADDPSSHRFECRSCGFVYDPSEGVKKLAIAPGTAFLELDPVSFRCPVCRSRVGAFKDIGPRNKPSGFEENLNFGLGVNRLTPGQKNVLIFGAFALAIAFFLSLYSLR